MGGNRDDRYIEGKPSKEKDVESVTGAAKWQLTCEPENRNPSTQKQREKTNPTYEKQVNKRLGNDVASHRIPSIDVIQIGYNYW